MVKRLSLIVIFLAVTPLEIKANWQFLDLPTDRGYTTIFAPNEASIFVDGHYGLWKTYDSGSTWAIDSHSVLGYNWITDICFTDSLRGFIAGADTTAKGGGIRRTLDGGKTWGKVSFDTVGENLAAKFSFPHSQKLTGYAMGGTCVFKTTDGGGTWKWISTIPLVYPGYEEYDVYRDICFPKVDTGYLTGEFRYKVDSNYYPAHYGFFKTTDGGQTWKMDSVPLYNDDFNPNLVVFPENPSVGYMTGGYIKDTTWTGCVFKTIDGGATWDTVLKTPVGHPDIYDICFPETDQVGYVLNDTMIHKTMDGGRTRFSCAVTSSIIRSALSQAQGRTQQAFYIHLALL